jgi:hypothetical protein
MRSFSGVTASPYGMRELRQATLRLLGGGKAQHAGQLANLAFRQARPPSAGREPGIPPRPPRRKVVARARLSRAVLSLAALWA